MMGSPPAPRYHHSAVVNEGSMFVFGKYSPSSLFIEFLTVSVLDKFAYFCCRLLDLKKKFRNQSVKQF